MLLLLLPLLLGGRYMVACRDWGTHIAGRMGMYQSSASLGSK